MDHVPRAEDPVVDLIKFVYEGLNYQCSSFDEYPASQGLETDELLQGSASNAKAHLQTWFYFGLLSQVLGPINQTDFLYVQSNGKQYLTTRYLDRYVSTWWTTVKTYSTQEQKARFEEAHRCNTFVAERLYLYDHNNLYNLIGEEFSLAIHILGATLSHVVSHYAGVASRSAWRTGLPLAELKVPWPPRDPYIDRRMFANGWCPNEIARFGDMLSPLTQIFALGFKRTGQVNHDICTEYECAANNVDNNYKTAHSEDNCSCEFLSVDVAAITAILKKSKPGIPLLRLRQKPDSMVVAQVVEYRPWIRFVAVSHVWSDGMGNNDANALPQCQLKKLYRLGGGLLTDPAHIAIPHEEHEPLHTLQKGIAHIYHQTPIALGVDRGVTTLWLDTLCIPLDEITRRIAIKGMADVYKKAHRVMILDSELISISCKTHEESVLRIMMCSGWMRRLWTLQEGIFANQRAYVYFKNRAIRPRQLVEQLSDEFIEGKIPVLNEPIVYDSFGHWLHLFGMTQAYTSKTGRILNSSETMNLSYVTSGLWTAVTRRSTSKDSDRPVVMASLLNLDVGQILNIPAKESSSDTTGGVCGGPVERMRKLYELMGEVPQGIIFQSGERFPDAGWRWAVKRCKSEESSGRFQGRISDIPGRICLPHGLMVHFPGIVVRHENIIKDSSVESSDSHPHLELVVGSVKYYTYPRGKEVTFETVIPRCTFGIGFIFGIGKLDKLSDSGASVGQTALMVSIYRQEQGILYSSREDDIFIRRRQQAPSRVFGTCRDALIVHGKQKWCVG